nr:DNA cytosine methyltransferase [Mycobacterium intracellulare]
MTVSDDRKLRVVDLFCGPGGISEGLRQAGCDTVFALDYDKQAVETFGANHPEAVVVHDDIRNLDPSTLPECDIVVGGPPCIEFSTSKGSRGNILEGLELVQAYLRIVHYVKPKWWIMENVPRVTKFLPDVIPLSWIGLDEDGTLRIPVRNVFNAAEYGVPQRRKRFLMGCYPVPQPTHSISKQSEVSLTDSDLPTAPTLGDILKSLPSATKNAQKRSYVDPNYGFELATKDLTDQFHETWIDDREAQRLRGLKLNHPYMGKMSFPDDLTSPARTVVATQLGRETLVIEDGGRFRRPTVREVATLQSFPFTYQFFGSASARYRLVGDAVPPLLGFAIGRLIRDEGGLPPIDAPVGATAAAIKRAPALPPLPDRTAKRAQNKPDRKFAQMLPGKEVRGCRAELDNRGDPAGTGVIVRWRAVLHVGEGSTRQEMEVDTVVATRALTAFYNEPEFAQLIVELLHDVDKFLSDTPIEVTALQTAWVDADTDGGPDSLVDQLNSLVDKWLPRSRWSNLRRTTTSLPILKPTGIRVRVAVGLLLAARVAELAGRVESPTDLLLLDRWQSAVDQEGSGPAAKSTTDRLSLF